MDLVLPPYWYVVLYMEGMTMETCSLLIMVKLALSLEGKNFTVHDKPCYFFSLKKKKQSILLYSNIYEQQSAIAISYKIVYLRIFSSVKLPAIIEKLKINKCKTHDPFEFLHA